eukprot:TRINITY_DN4601_c0_g1_i1.p1 TRINITY_DN4601_c0_g1~~TRINITY_DN4601_c0_g1_i1.p1  ORF type:complete len:195 (-),score=8.59 TRINITY_DN4601_c0_g1_i1:36-620(-)
MKPSGGKRGLYSIVLLLIILYTGLHIAVAIYGIKSRNDLRDHVPGNSYLNQVYDSELLREAIFLFVTAGAIFIMALLLLMVSCCRISPRMRHVLATFIMMLLFVIGVVLLLRNRHNADLNDFSEISPPVGVSFRDQYSNFNTYYKLVWADWIGSFFFSVIAFFFLYLPTLSETTHHEIINPVVVEVPPMSNRQF